MKKLNEKPPARVNPVEIRTDAEMLKALGPAMFGERWQSPLADLVGISKGHLHGIVGGTKSMTPAVKAKFAEVLNDIRGDVMDDARYRILMIAAAIVRFEE